MTTKHQEEPEVSTYPEYGRIMEQLSRVIEQNGKMAGDIAVMASELHAVKKQLEAINGKVQRHQTWIDRKDGEIKVWVALVAAGGGVGGIITGLVMHLLKTP